MKPARIQLRRTRGWRMPPDTVFVARPSLFGNPFVHDDPAQAVEAYRRFIAGGTQCFDMGPGKLQFAKRCHPQTLNPYFCDLVKSKLPEIRGKNLACWCRPDQPCHADVLLELANREKRSNVK